MFGGSSILNAKKKVPYLYIMYFIILNSQFDISNNK